MLLLTILIISILTLCKSYNLRGSIIFENSLVNQNNNNYENSLVNKNSTITQIERIKPINEKYIECHPDILPENCNARALYPYPINTKNYRICYQDTITINNKNNIYMYVKYHKLDLLLYTYLVYFDGISAKADVQGWCPILI